jgi:dihydroorotase
VQDVTSPRAGHVPVEGRDRGPVLTADLRITNAQVCTPQGFVRGGVAVKDGRIAAIAWDDALPPAPTTIDAAGRPLLPGLVDAHVHFREPGLTHKEDFVTASRAAVRGGVTTVLDMPNTVPPVETAVLLADKAEVLARRSLVDFGLIAAITDRNLDRIEELAVAGAVAYKIFLGPTTGNLSCPDDAGLVEALTRAAAVGRPVGVHAENPAIVAAATARLKAQGRVDPGAHADARPVLAEAESILRMICFARVTGARLHVLHVSSAAGLELVRAAKADGLAVTAETCPHYLTLTAADLAALGPVAKMNPPLRGPADVEALWQGVRNGSIDYVATDHAPHAVEEKTRPAIWDNASGVSSVQFFGPIMLEQVARGRLTLADFARVTGEAPARRHGLYPQKGAIAVGSDADLVLVDLERRAPVRAADMENKVKLTPFDGMECRGWPVLTLVRGAVVMREGAVVGTPGAGRCLRVT